MSQITRCPSCATMFKVVADQLRISEGWVRCGHCQQVFDASAHLQPSQPPPLMPDMALDKVRPPPQPVPRTDPPARAWGAPAGRPAPAPVASPQASTPPVVTGKAHESFMDTGSGAKTLEVPESTVPAFLVADPVPANLGREMSGLMPAPLPPLTWVPPSEMPSIEPPAAQAPMMEWPTIEFTPEPSPAVSEMGYELPAPVLEDGDACIEPGQDQADSAQWEDVAAHAVQEPPTERALRDALNEVLARRPGLQPEPLASMPEQEPEGGASAEQEEDLPPQRQEFAHSEDEPPDGAEPDTVTTDPVPESVSAEEDSRNHGLPSVSSAEVEPGADALAGELSFVRAARRKAFWRKTSVRTSLVLLGLVLLCGLLLQVAVHERRLIAATWPALRPYLEQLCAPLQCSVEPYRQIAAVIVDGSTFHKIKGDQYQFSLTLKNRSETRVEMPAVELTLTDAQDQPVLRRVLTPQDLAAPAELSAQGEWNLAASLLVNLGSTRITGYRVLAFYP